MAYVLGEPTVQQYFDATGAPLVNGTIEFYVWDTTTPATVYSDATGTAIGTSVTLGALGQPINSGVGVALFFDTEVTYKIIRKDSGGTPIDPTIGPYFTGLTTDSDTLAGLPALTPADGDIVVVNGDGWSYPYKYDASSTATADGVLVILPNSGTGRWEIQTPNPIPLTLWGLSTSATAAVNATALQTAVNNAHRRTLLIPDGTYNFGTTITLDTADTILRGSRNAILNYTTITASQGLRIRASGVELRGFKLTSDLADETYVSNHIGIYGNEQSIRLR